MYTCDACTKYVCRTGNLAEAPLNCPCRELDNIEEIKKFYLEKENMKLAHNSALTESEGYCKQTRVEEIINFANKCGYKKLGLAFCVGPVSYTHMTLPTKNSPCRSRWSPYQ